MSIRSGWRRLRERISRVRRVMRSSELMGRTFSLRDRGKLEEALATCQEALELARVGAPTQAGPIAFSTIVSGALTIDEIASQLGKPELARGPLEEALKILESLSQASPRPLRPEQNGELLLSKERKIRERLRELRSSK